MPHLGSTRVAAVSVLALLVGLGLGVGVHNARAADGDGDGERLVCRVFPIDLDSEGGWDSADGNHPIGAWVTTMNERGWSIASVGLSVGQKPTGYAQGYQQVCLSPR